MLSLIRPSIVSATGLRCVSSSAAVQAGKKKVIDPTLPTVPRGPSTAYTLFFKNYFNDEKDKYVSESGKLSLTSLAKAAGTAWNALPATDKAPYLKNAAELKESFNKLYKEFYQSLSPETKKSLERQLGKKLVVPGGKVASRKLEAGRTGNPGKPLGAFFVFLKELRESGDVDLDGLGGQERTVAIAKRGGEKWKAMSEEEKLVYKEKAKDMKTKFDEWAKSV
ncbi:hypothetical protein P7C73_g808, partial [Tremellales sp. Uapishka_1]